MHRRWLELFHRSQYEVGGGESPAPGTEGEAPGGTDDGTPAGAVNSETSSTPPGPVPYARFKEVNDSRRELAERITPYRELEEAGYGVADLQRLTAWEQEFIQDPSGWLINTLLQTDGVPESVKAAVQAAKGEVSAETTPAGSVPKGEESEEELPEWAKVLMSDREARIQAEQQAQAAREAEEASRTMDTLVEAWNKLDERDKVKTPPRTLIAYLGAAAQQGGDPITILRSARESYLSDRTEILGEVVSQAGDGSTAPRSVPGGGGGDAPLTTPRKPKTLDEARRLAEEADRRGNLIMNQ